VDDITTSIITISGLFHLVAHLLSLHATTCWQQLATLIHVAIIAAWHDFEATAGKL
jgi:hypothetical protein